jgi:hypothetical protein
MIYFDFNIWGSDKEISAIKFEMFNYNFICIQLADFKIIFINLSQ